MYNFWQFRGRGRPRKNRDPLDDFVVYDEEELERERRKKRIKRERMVGDTRHRVITNY